MKTLIKYAQESTGCEKQQAACHRFMADFDDGRLFFDEEAFHRVCRFFEVLRFTKGEWRGVSFELQPWQRFIIGNLFGWKLKATGLRRFRTAFIMIPRKNGKSELGAGIGLYLAFGDKEPGAEVYSAATKRDQAKIVFDQASQMIRLSAMKSYVGIHQGNLHQLQSGSKFEPLSSDSKTMDGLNVHGAIIDEVHAHKTREVIDLLDTATGARRQPMLVQLTTAGVRGESIGREQYDYSAQVLDQTLDDDTFFAFITEVEDGDDWRDEDVWWKANPNLGVSVKLEDMRRKAIKAKAVPAAQNAFRRMHLNEWTEQANRWLDLPTWDACKRHPFPNLDGLRCVGALDLSSTLDLSALILLFENGMILPRFWCPEQRIDQRSHDDQVPYRAWVEAGLLTATEGRTVNYDFIRADINNMREIYQMDQMAIDRWNATQLTQQLRDDGLDVVPFGQGFVSMASPTKELERMIVARELQHDGNPVMRWMISNVAVAIDPAGNMKPAKDKSREKIDGVVALIMAIGLHLQHHDTGSVYDNCAELMVV